MGYMTMNLRTNGIAWCFLVLVFGLALPTAQATVIAYEGFDYPAAASLTVVLPTPKTTPLYRSR